jgi:sirohydrochlorin ferrochelatase
MNPFFWLLSFLLSFIAGLCLLHFLVASPLRMAGWLAASLILIFGVVLIFSALKPAPLPAIMMGCLSCLWGYLSATWIFLHKHEPIVPFIIQPSPSGKHTVVLYFTHGEPPVYSPFPWLETMRELDKDKAPFIPWLFRPFFFYHLRGEYLRLGRSTHNEEHARILAALQHDLPDLPNTSFYLAYLDSSPRPDEVAVQAVNAGAKRILLLPVFLTESTHTQAGREMVAALNLEQYGVEIVHAAPLWDSPDLQDLYLRRAETGRGGTLREKTGLLLVGHGQPETWDRLYPTQTSQEQSFREILRDKFIAAGYPVDNIELAWMEFKQPTTTQAARQLAALNLEKLLVFPASISAASIHSDIQIPEQVAKAHLPPQVEIINLGAWGNDPCLVAALQRQVLNSLKGDVNYAR